MQKHIFNKYDIRGKVGQDLNIDQVDRLTRAIVSFYKKNDPALKRIAVALDGRMHSQEIYQKVSQAIVDSGLQVYFLGICPTPVFVFGLYNLPVQAGIMITGSYQAKEFNGFKLYLNKKVVWGKQIQNIYDLFVHNKKLLSNKPGKIVPSPILDQYIESIWQEFAYLSQYDFSMVIDCAHGSVGPIIKKLIKKMGWKHAKSIHDELDSSFPVHEPNPSDIKNMHQLHQALIKKDQSFGIAFDGDASCMVGLENNGTLILGDRLLALFSQDVLRNKKSVSVVYDIKSSMLVKELVEKYKGIAVVSSSGVPLIQDKMNQVGALLGGEVTGHYFFRDRHTGYDDGIYAMCRLLDVLVKERKSIYELLSALPKKYSSYEIRIPCVEDQKHIIIQKVIDVVTSQKKWKTSQVDGVRAEMNHGWGLLRACQTQSMVSFRCEAKNKHDLTIVKKEFKELLKPHIKEDVLKEFF